VRTKDIVQPAMQRDDGFTLPEMLVAIAILTIVSGTVMKGILDVSDVSRTVSNRTDMHSGVRNATELLTQEIGQAGRITLPGRVTLSAASAMSTTSLTVASTATDLAATTGMFPGQHLLLGTGDTQEPVVVSAVNGATITLSEGLVWDHVANEPLVVVGGFREGVVPPVASGYLNGSTPSVLKIFGDIHDDGRMVYVEYTCDLVNGRLYRNSMAYDGGVKPMPTVEQVLIDNIQQNPPDPTNGTITPCFTYQVQTVVAQPYVVDVAVTLTILSQNIDKNTGTFHRETKALLNVSPRNVFNVWQLASLGMKDHIQPIPPVVTQLLAAPYTTTVTTVVEQVY
jgi:prepilin-type N-terminal cleavage/methylation domain-containing protein